MTSKKDKKAKGSKKEAQADNATAAVTAVAEGEETSTMDQKALEATIAQMVAKEEEDKLTDAEAKALAKGQKTLVKEAKKIAESDADPTVKIEQLQAKLLALITESKGFEKNDIVKSRKLEKVLKEKELAVSEVTKLSAVKGKLETLCRELQKQNKAVLDDSRRVAEEEHNKRAELNAKFQDTIKDVSTKLDAQGEDRIKQFQENDALREKLKNFGDQYEIREQHFAHQLKTKDLEHQLLEAKLKHATEVNAQEGQKLSAYKAELEARTKTEIELRQQLATYSEKFESFQDTLGKSNEVFTTFKKEMDKMTKTIKKLEKENLELKLKAKKSDVALLNMHEDQENSKKALETSKKQNAQLQSLCKTLQEEKKKAREEAKKSQEAVDNFNKAELD